MAELKKYEVSAEDQEKNDKEVAEYVPVRYAQFDDKRNRDFAELQRALLRKKSFYADPLDPKIFFDHAHPEFKDHYALPNPEKEEIV